jgi:hypothetical protein
MYDPVEDFPLLLIVENNIANGLTIELYAVVLKDPFAKVFDDGVVARGPWFDHRSSEVVGVDNRKTVMVVQVG